MMKNIILAIDFIEHNQIILNKSLEIVKRLGAKVWVIHIAAPDPAFIGYEAGPDVERKFRADELREEHKIIQEIAKSFRQKGIESEALLFPGPTVETLVKASEKLNADMIIIGFHKSGFLSGIFGDITIGVLKKAKIPILSIPTY